MKQTMPMQLEMITCPSCEQPFPKKRKELGYHVCISCSTEKPKVGRLLTFGTGEEIYQDIEIVDHETAKRLADLEAYARGKKTPDLEILDFNQDEDDTDRQVKENARKVLEDEDDYEEVQEDDESVLKDLSKEKPE